MSCVTPDIVFAPGQRSPRLPADVQAFVAKYDAGMKSGWPDQPMVTIGRARKMLPLAWMRLRQEMMIESIKDSNRRHIGLAARIKREGFDSRDADMADYGRPWSEQEPFDADFNAFSSYERIRTPAMRRYERFVNRRPDADPGYQGPDFVEHGDRTRSDAHGDVADLMRFVACTPARPKAGPCKDSPMVAMPRRAALNCRYNELGRYMPCFRLDTDDVWEDFDELRGRLQDLYDAGEIPVLPHVTVSDRDAEGRICRPHLLIFLPPGDHVDARQKRTVALLRAVARGWIRKLRAHGIAADPGGLSNMFRIKNPISPYMTTGIVNAEHYVSLRDQAAFWSKAGVSMAKFDVNGNEWRDPQDDKSPQSQEEWLLLRHQVWGVICPRERDGKTDRYRSWLGRENGKMKFEPMFADLMAEVWPWAQEQFPTTDPQRLFRSVRAACKQCAELWDDSKRQKLVDRGVMRREGLIPDGFTELEVLQHMSAERTARIKRDRSIEKIAAAIGGLIAAGVVPDLDLHRKQVIAETGLCRTTVDRWWIDADWMAQTAHDAAKQTTAAEAIDGHGGEAPLVPEHEPEREIVNPLEYFAKIARPIVVTDLSRRCVGKKEETNSAISSNLSGHELAPDELRCTIDPDDYTAPFDLAGWLESNGFVPGPDVAHHASGTLSWADNTCAHRLPGCTLPVSGSSI